MGHHWQDNWWIRYSNRIRQRRRGAPSLRNPRPRSIKRLARQVVNLELYVPYLGVISYRFPIFSFTLPFDGKLKLFGYNFIYLNSWRTPHILSFKYVACLNATAATGNLSVCLQRHLSFEVLMGVVALVVSDGGDPSFSRSVALWEAAHPIPLLKKGWRSSSRSFPHQRNPSHLFSP